LSDEPKDSERNRFSARASRYARVGANVGGVAAKIASQRFLGVRGKRADNAASLAAALGGLKGPLMKVAQLLSTIPDALACRNTRASFRSCNPKRRRWAGLS